MPGMMETVLNLGLNDEIVEGLVEKSGDPRFYDVYRRFVQMYAVTSSWVFVQKALRSIPSSS